ncbi:POK9 protein, partial [Motacilla alba]|nr:POK9 protein [Motacilla alba]
LTSVMPQKIPTGVKGPIYASSDSGLGALLLGRSSASMAGLIVLPGVIDADFTGEIMIVAYTLTPPLIVKKGTRIAQLVLYLKVCTESDVFRKAPKRGDKGFGSTGDTLVNLVQQMKQRPMISLLLKKENHQVKVLAMLDTGADVTIIS